MNFYKHFIGDFQRDTGHLSLTERGAYLALMHHYYATEQALPMDHTTLCRIASAFSKPERDAVKVAMKFFEQRDGALWHKRIEAEIEKAEGQSDTNRRIALDREARKRAEKEAREQHEACTKRAPGVPDSLHEKSTPHSHSQSSLRSEEEPRKRAATLDRPDDVAEQVWADWVQLRKTKRATVTATVIAEARTEAAKASLTLERFLAVWCARGSQGLQADWLKPQERGNTQQASGETPYQRSMRERVEQFAPGVAARAPGQSRPLTFIEEVQDVPAIASR